MTTYKVKTPSGWVYIDNQNYDARYILASSKGSNSGVASLDESGHVIFDQLPSSITGAVNYRGVFDPTEGAPSPAAAGYYYVSSGVGTISATSFSTGDWLVYTDGSSWNKIANSSASVTWNNVSNKPDVYTPDTHDNSSHSESYITTLGVTYEALANNNDVGDSANQVASGVHTHSGYQPLDGDLTSIAGLSGTAGLLRKTAANTYQLDTNNYLTELTTATNSILWNSQALPSIDDATGEQVLRLKSDKSALEFATVSGGTSSYDDLTDIPAAISAIDGLTPAANKIPYYTAADSGALADLPSGYNYIINPCFEVNQRGVASQTTSGTLTVDMWRTGLIGDTATFSQQAFTVGQTDVPGEPKNYLRIVNTYASGAGNLTDIFQSIEDVRTLAGQTVTISFYAKADAAKPVAIAFVQTFGTGGSSTVNTHISKITLSTSWAKYTISGTVPSISGKTVVNDTCRLQLFIIVSAGSTFNAISGTLGQQSGTFEFANVKLESGTVATPFRVPTYAEELAKCRRYLKPLGVKSAAYEYIANGMAVSATSAQIIIPLTPPMRATPTLITPTAYANFKLYNGSINAALSANPSIFYTSTNALACVETTIASGLTIGDSVALGSNNHTTDAMYLSAEL